MTGLPPSRYDIGADDLARILDGQPAYRTRQVWDALHRNFLEPEDMSNLPLDLRAELARRLPRALTLATSSSDRQGETTKFLWHLRDGAAIETVLMHYPDRATVCVSTQAGCAMACSFCATGQAGFERQLSSGEIVEQVIAAARVAAPRRVSNIVFMGMGEPLANFDATWAAVERLHSDVGISARHLTISTVGVLPGIRRLAEAALPVNLAVSLHAATAALRDELVPINRRYPLADLADACAAYLVAKNRRLSFEWAMIAGVNDTVEQADALAAYAGPLRAHVNLIPLNPTPGYAVRGSDPAAVDSFRDRLTRRGINATVRRNRGTDIDAACGQLRAAHAVAPPTQVGVSSPRRLAD